MDRLTGRGRDGLHLVETARRRPRLEGAGHGPAERRRPARRRPIGRFVQRRRRNAPASLIGGLRVTPTTREAA